MNNIIYKRTKKKLLIPNILNLIAVLLIFYMSLSTIDTIIKYQDSYINNANKNFIKIDGMFDNAGLINDEIDVAYLNSLIDEKNRLMQALVTKFSIPDEFDTNYFIFGINSADNKYFQTGCEIGDKSICLSKYQLPEIKLHFPVVNEEKDGFSIDKTNVVELKVDGNLNENNPLITFSHGPPNNKYGITTKQEFNKNLINNNSVETLYFIYIENPLDVNSQVQILEENGFLTSYSFEGVLEIAEFIPKIQFIFILINVLLVISLSSYYIVTLVRFFGQQKTLIISLKTNLVSDTLIGKLLIHTLTRLLFVQVIGIIVIFITCLILRLNLLSLLIALFICLMINLLAYVVAKNKIKKEVSKNVVDLIRYVK